MKHLLNLALFAALCAAQAPSYTISNFAGTGASGFTGDGSAATSAQLNTPFAVAVSGSNVYIADQVNNRIRLVSNGSISTFAGSGTSGNSGDGSTATKANMAAPTGVATDSSGNVYFSDTLSASVRKVSGGNVNNFAGTPGTVGFIGDGAAATAAAINYPSGLAIDSSNNVYICDTFNNRIRKVTSDGNINTIAGDGDQGFVGDEGPATAAAFYNPEGIAVDAQGNIYIADGTNNRIRKITTDGIIHSIAGSSTTGGFAGDGGPATKALLNHPRGVAVDGAGNVYFADSFNNRIRMITPGGIIYTIAGTGAAGYAGDGGPAILAQLKFPTGVTVSGANLYVVDSDNHAVRLLTPSPTSPNISPGGVIGATAYGGSAIIAPGSWIEIYGSNLSTTTRPWNTGDFNGFNAPTSLDGVSVTIGGQPAFVAYVSPNQVNVQVPSTVGAGPQQIVITNSTGSSGGYGVTVNPTQPGLLAPAQFVIGGKQYVAAYFADGTSVLPPNSVSGVTSRQAKPGETIVLYGVGLGPVTPVTKAGTITHLLNSVQTPVQILFGQTAGTVTYQGLAPGYVGLYQINVVVPSVGSNDASPISISQGGVTSKQTLFTAIKN
jgi:uncharacterized protein (TIGR03437 family)